MKHSEQINEIATALALAQSQMTVVSKDATNPAFKSKYATLSNVIDAIRPHLSANGIAFSQGLERLADQYVMTTMLLHKSGQWLSYEFPLTIPDLKASTVGHLMQTFGAVCTYSAKYSLTAACGCAPGEEDDDGETAKQTPVMKKEESKISDEFKTLSDSILLLLKEKEISSRFIRGFCLKEATEQNKTGIEIMKEFLKNKESFFAKYTKHIQSKVQ